MALLEDMEAALAAKKERQRKEQEMEEKFIEEWVALTSSYLTRGTAEEQARFLLKWLSKAHHSHPLQDHFPHFGSDGI